MSEAIARQWPAIKRWVLFYLYAAGATSWNAGIQTMAVSLGLAAGAAIEPDKVYALDAAQMVIAFKYGAIINLIMYLKTHPIPEKLPTSTP